MNKFELRTTRPVYTIRQQSYYRIRKFFAMRMSITVARTYTHTHIYIHNTHSYYDGSVEQLYSSEIPGG